MLTSLYFISHSKVFPASGSIAAILGLAVAVSGWAFYGVRKAGKPDSRLAIVWDEEKLKFSACYPKGEVRAKAAG